MPDLSNKTKRFLRKAEPEDVNLLFQWVNDPETRQNSFDSHTISYEEHENWFNNMMQNPNRIQYIMMDGDVPVGQIRLDISGDEAEISYSIAPDKRGKGYGKQIISLSKKVVLDNYPVVRKLKAAVKSQNMASISCFESNGFSERYCKDHRIYELNVR